MPDRKPLSYGRATGIGPDPRGIHSGIGPDPSMDIDTVMDKYGGLLGVGGLKNEGAPMLKSIGKRIDEMLDWVLTTDVGKKLPQRLQLTGWDARKGTVKLHPVRGTDVASPATSAAKYEATPAQIDELIESGRMDIAQPPPKDVERVRRKISTQLDKK